MAYRVEFSPRAERPFSDLLRPVQARLKPRLDAWADHPRPPGREKLSEAEDLYRIRVGDDRVIGQIQDQVLVVLVVKVGHWRDIYRRGFHERCRTPKALSVKLLVRFEPISQSQERTVLKKQVSA